MITPAITLFPVTPTICSATHRNSGPYGAGVVCQSGCTFSTTFGSTSSAAGP